MKPNPDRRELLAGLGAAAALAVAGAGGCAAEPEEKLLPGQVGLELASLVPGKRVTVIVSGNPVELIRTGNDVSARSLRCTHTGCVVRWREELREYRCPCHEGRYSEQGEVLSGPPPKPLRSVPVSTRNGRTVVG
jgi:cytochrome b6-f complex iron-sulfur subunit